MEKESEPLALISGGTSFGGNFVQTLYSNVPERLTRAANKSLLTLL